MHQQQQEVSTGKKKPLFTRPKTFAAHLGGRRPGVIYALSPTLKKKIRETKDPLEKSMLANSGWRGDASLVSALESNKSQHTAYRRRWMPFRRSSSRRTARRDWSE
jgi:hypothetical protein